MDSAIAKSTHLLEGSALCDFTVFQRPWGGVPCPAGFTCDINVRPSMWGCWLNASTHPVCYPIGNGAFRTSLTLLNPGDPAQGVLLFRQGYGDMRAQIQIECDPRLGVDSFFPLDFRVTLWTGLYGGDNYTFTAKSELVCPKAYLKSEIPRGVRTPPPSAVEKDSARAFRVNFKNEFSLDLTLFKAVVQDVIIGSDQFYEKVTVRFSAADRTGAIPGYSARYDDANVWKCWTSDRVRPVCIPIGDFRYGLDVGPLNESNLSEGVRVRYRGGLGGYETEVILTCDEKLDDQAIAFQPIGGAIYPSRTITLFATTNQVCQGHILLWRDEVTIGGIAVCTSAAVAALYLLIGVIITTCREKEVHVPNYEFWGGFCESLRVAIIRIFVCRVARRPREISQSCENFD
jgi:hypothetical protein